MTESKRYVARITTDEVRKAIGEIHARFRVQIDEAFEKAGTEQRRKMTLSYGDGFNQALNDLRAVLDAYDQIIADKH